MAKNTGSDEPDAGKDVQEYREPGVLDLLRVRMQADIALGREGAADEATESILEAIMQAETLEDLIEAQNGGLASAEDLLGTPLRFRDFHFNKSTIAATPDNPNPLPGYAVIDAVNLETGRETKIGCSGVGIMAVLTRLEQKSWLPVDMVFETKKTGAGFDVLKLRFLNAMERDFVKSREITVPASEST